ncbi:MAG: hypothetical protein WCP46_00785 [Alphaproteobacteria bacterium]
MEKKFKEVFTNIYNDKEWGVSRDHNTSGTGDIINNLPFFLFIEKLLNIKKIKAVLDFGCGDWSLMKYVSFPEDTIYIGLDIVQSVIENNNQKYKKEKKVTFYNIGNDYSEIQSNDKYHAELLLVKNVFENWPLENVQDFLNNVLHKFKYTLFSCFYNPRGYNANTPVGWFHTLNMFDFDYPKKNNIRFLFASEIYDGTYNAYYLYDNSSKDNLNIENNMHDLLLPLQKLKSANVLTDFTKLDEIIFQNKKYATYPQILNQFRKKYNIQKFIWGNNNEVIIHKDHNPLSIMIGGFEYAKVIFFRGFNCQPSIKKIENGLYEMRFENSDNRVYLYSFNDDIEKLMPYLLKSQLFTLS